MYDTRLEKTFGNEYKILKIFLMQPKGEINLASAVQQLKISKMTLYRNLERLVKIGILKSRSDNYRRFYKLVDSPIISGLKILINVDSPIVTEVLKNFKSKSRLIILYGSRANGTNRMDSDWDFIIVSDELDVVSVNKKNSELEAKYDCQINIKLYTFVEYSDIKTKRTPFYLEVMSSKYMLKGDIDET